MPPTVISHYRVVRPLGAGGMGQVFLAEDTKLDRSVALKLLPNEVSEDASRRKRFLAEAKAASALNHSSVCTIYEVGETPEGQPFIAMEYLKGQALEALVRCRRLELREIVGIGVQVAEALEAARQHQVVHRDIKPGNIMVDAQGRVKVLDFGLAKRLDRPADASNVTQEGAIVGTPNYLSPELALGREVDSRSDIFSLGVVLYELAAGKNPFAGASFGETVNNILNKNPEPLKPWNPNVKAEFERIVFKCLEKDPAKRYATPAQLREDLAKAEAHLQTPRSSTRTVLALAVAVVAVAIAAAGWLAYFHRTSTGGTKVAARITSLAVKPLDDFSGDTNNAYLSDGMTEALCSALGKISALRVPGRSSVMGYKGSQKSIRAMAKDLEVDAIVEGSVQRAGNRILVTVQLIEAATDRHIWSAEFKRDLSDFFAVQSEVARAIADEVQVRLTPEDEARLARARAAKPEAIEAYLKGRFYLYQYTGPTSKQAIDLLNQAIALDPAFAKAHAGLAAAYAWVSSMYMHPREAMPLAKRSAEKALELDDSLAEAHHAYATIKWWGDWDFDGAELEFKRSLDLNPKEAQVYCDYAQFLGQQGRFDEALKTANQAAQLSPADGTVRVAWVYSDMRRHDQAVAFLRRALDLSPNFATAHQNLASEYLAQEKFDEAIAEGRKALELAGEREWYLLRFGIILARSGRTDEARKCLEEINQLMLQKKYLSPVSVASLHEALGEREQAITWLQRAYEDRCDHLLELNVLPEFDSLRADPRFTELLRKVGFNPTGTNAAAPAPQKSVAVLPFVNMSADKGDEYLSDGMTEELLNALTKIKGLRVPGRSSCFAFKGRNEGDIFRRVGEQLHVGAVLEGSVRKAGNQLRITAQLINVADGFHLWSETYDRDMTNIFAIQSDIATRMAEALKGQLLGEERHQLAKRSTENTEAYRLYLQGRYHWAKYSVDGWNKALDYFNQAIQQDPNYALAYAGKADAYNWTAMIGLPAREAFEKGKTAAQKALELDDALAEAHVAMGTVSFYLWKWAAAEKEYQRAIQLNPNSALTRDAYGNFLVAQGRFNEAVHELQLAIELDPLSSLLTVDLGWAFYQARQYERTIEETRKSLELDQNFGEGHRLLGWCYVWRGQTNEALAQMLKLKTLDDVPWNTAGLAYAYAISGKTNEALRIMQEWDTTPQPRHVAPASRAIVYLGLGDTNRALTWLEQACEARDTLCVVANSDPIFDNVRSHPRFQALLRKMNLLK